MEKRTEIDQDQLILTAIANRRSIFPKSFEDRPIAKEDIEKLLAVANTAPTHRLTEPWRFKVLTEAALEKLGDWLANQYKQACHSDTFSQVKFDKTRKKPTQAGAVIVICMQRDTNESVPEWEEVAAVACAVQNMWIATEALGLGGYWSSPKAIADMDSFIPLAVGEICLGLFYLGHHQMPSTRKKRSDWSEKVTWISRK